MGTALLIGSCEPFSGKSALVLGIAQQLSQAGQTIRFGKPLATSLDWDPNKGPLPQPLIDDDVRFVGDTLGLSADNLLPSLHLLSHTTATQRLGQGDVTAGAALDSMRNQINADDALTLLECAGSLQEVCCTGSACLSWPRPWMLRWFLCTCGRTVAVLMLSWRPSRCSGNVWKGVVLNAVTPDEVDSFERQVVPALENLGLPVFGVMPRSPLLRSVTVGELVRRLDARVICCAERQELLVETLSIGAMNVNSAMEFFRRRRNMAVVTSADRTDIQFAALEASTQCLILTGAGEPLPQLISRAEELDVPLLKVEHDTLSTVGVIEQAFGHVRLHEAVKATYAFRLVEEHCDLDRLFQALNLTVQPG